MSCQVQTSKHLEFVKGLVKYDPKLYFNFDNAAKFILQSDLTPELKKISVHNVALIYKTLDLKQPNVWTLGNAEKVLSSEHLIDDTKNYMKAMSDMFSTKVPGIVTIETVNKAIDALAKKSTIVEGDLVGVDGVISMFNNFLASHSMPESEIENARTQFKASVTKAINEVLDGSAAKYMIDLLNARMDIKKATTPYIPMSDIAELAKLQPVIITLNDRTVVEGIVEDDVVKAFNADGTYRELKVGDYISYGEISYQSEGNSIELVLAANSINSHLVIKAANPAKQAEVMDAIQKSANLRSDVEIFAINLNTADARLERIRTNTPTEVGDRRRHETFENASQIEYLSTNPAGSVVSVARPNFENNLFSIVGVIKSTGEIFNVYSFDNYVSVDSNNNTRVINLDNKEDKDLFKNKVLKSTNEGAVAINNVDIATINNAVKTHRAFKTSLFKQIGSDLNTEGSVNITSEFFDTYNFNVKRDVEDVRLDRILGKDKTLSLPLAVATLDADGSIVSTEDRNIPFTFIKINDVYTLNSFLGANERIIAPGEDGTDQKYTEEEYFKSILEKIPGYESGALAVSKFITNEILKGSPKESERISIRFNAEGIPFSYAPINTKKAFQDLGNFGIMFSQLYDIIQEKDEVKKSEKLKQFQKFYRFAGGKNLFYIDFVNLKDSIQLRLNPTATADVYNEMMLRASSSEETEEGKKKLLGNFYFPLEAKDLAKFKTIFTSIQLSSATHKAILAEIPSLSVYNVATPEGKADFITALSELADEGLVGNASENFLQNLASSRKLFSQFLVDHVIGTLEARTEKIPGFMEQIKQDFTWKGKVHLDRLLVYDRDGEVIPYMTITRENKQGTNRFYKNMKNWTVVKTSFPYVNVVNQAAPALEEDTKELLKAGMSPEVISTPGTFSSPAPVEPPVNQEVIKPEVKVDSEKILLSLASDGFKSAQYSPGSYGYQNVFDPRKDIIQDLMATRKSFAQIIEYKNKNWLVVGLTTVNDIDNAITSGRDNYSFATIEFNESLPNDIIETLEKAAKEHFKTNRNFNESEPIKPITDIDSRLFNKSTENNSDEDIISEENYSKGFKLEEGAFRFDTISDEQIKLQIAEVRKMLPQFEIDESALEDVLKLMSVDGTVLGLYKDRVIYLNDKLKVSGVVYHEAFHAVFRNFMNNEFRRELLDKVINSPKHASKFTEAAKQDFARRRGMVYNSAKITDLIAEEVLADGFQDYMLNKKKAPKGLLGQLFEMLKRLIALFVNNKTDIENLYGKISDGYYAKAVINAELYKGETAFELIPTVNRLYSELNKTVVQKRNLESKDQNQLVNFMVREMINLGKDAPATFDEKFDVASKKVLDEIFNVEKIVASNPENAQQIREALSDRFNQMRFVLGARLLENDLTPPSQRLYDTNATGNDSFGAKVMNIKNDEGKDNTLGQESRKVLKKLVQKRLQELVITSNEDPESISISKVEEFLNDPKYSVDTNEDTNDDDEVSEESFEKSINEISRIDGIPAEFRKFISTMRRDIYDEELGVYIPNMVDAKGIFNQLLKVTSNKYAEELIPHLEYVLKQNKEDYNSNEFVNDLEAVINEIKKLSNTNSQLYNLIINVLHGSELDLMFVRLSTADNSSENMSDEELISGPQETRVRIFEQLETADANETKKNFIASMTIANATRYKSPENEAKYKEALQAIQQITVDIKNNLASNNSILGELNPNKKLNSIVDELHESLNTIGLNLPKSLIKMSVLAMEVYENGKTLDKVSAENKIAYDNNQDIIRANNYLESGFFSALNEIAKAGLANKPFKGLIDDTSDRVIAYVQTFNNVLRRSSVYINKYNPAYIPSVVRNAENKPIYRYVKYTPLLSMALDIRRKGVLEAIKSDDEKVFNDFLNDYFKDHPMFDDFFNGNETSDKAKVINVLLDNMRIAMSGGAQQRIGEIYKDGKTFKGLDTKSALLFNLLMFMNRNTETGQKLSSKDEYAKLQLYLRNFGQLESSGTNFMMPAIYTKHVEEAKLKNKEQSFSIKKDGGHYAASKELLKVIRQEYERIRREWNKQAERADAFRNGDNQYVDGYNAKMSSSGEIITDDLSLRAYNFRKLDDAFNTDPELREQILSKARANVPFDSLLSEEYAEILYTLDEYINDQVKEQIAIYENAGVIKKEKAIVYTLPAGLKTEGLSEQEILDKRVPKDRTYYSSDFIPKNFKTDVGVKNTEINSAYGSGLKLFGKESSSTPNPTNYEALIADMYINDLINGVMFKDLFVGDEALGIKSVQDMLKRAKQYLATGDNGKEGYHKIAIANTYFVFIHNDYRTKGPFATIDEINDAEQYELSKPGANVDAIEEMYKKIREGFTAAYDNSNVEHKKYKKMLTEIFNGQSYALTMHQMDFLESRGRLNESAKELLIASHYRPLTASEIYKLENLKIVLNSQKTVTSSRVDYIKMSEGVILRSSVSRLKDDMIDARLATMPEGSTREDAIDSIHENLHDEWSAVYSMRKQIQELSKTESIHNSDSINALEQDIKETIKNIHSYYRPVESRMMLHNILNAMEYHQIDHFMDTESSKTMTYLQSSTGRNALEQAVKMEAGYLPINTNARWIQNKHKYAQVETSGVSDTAKFSVQSKVLAPADVDNLAEIISKTQGRTLTADETEQLNSITKRLLQDYEGALKDSTAGRLLYLTNILREGGDFKIAKVYDLIRENLAAQGATPALLAMFEVVGDKPKYSPNLPQLRKVLEYYFFSQYSKNVTDEKGSGGKYIHISSLGYNVYEDVNTGKIIPTDVYEANPEAYEVRTRPLSVTQEDSIDADGNPVTTYFAEVILPKPLVDNPDFMAFYEQYLTKMFATRIPTEDKRSMIVLKAVDYLDSSNMNGIVVPHFIHLLAGSDFDIDTLYVHSKAYYTDMAGMYNLYGNYENYPTDEEGKFAEFVHFIARKKDFSKLIKKRQKDLLEQGSFDVTSDTMAMLEILGYSPEEFQAVMDVSELDEQYQALTDEINSLTELKDLKKEELEDYIQNEVIKPRPTRKKKSILKSLQELGDQEQIARAKEISRIGRNRQVLIEQRRELRRQLKENRAAARQLKNSLLKVQSTFDVMRKYNIPTTQAAFEANPDFAKMVMDKHQNNMLDSKINLIGNKWVYDNLYINESSSVQMFERIADAFGLDLGNVKAKINGRTSTYASLAKEEVGIYKDAIGKAANINKFLSMASWYNLKLKSPIWNFSNGVKEEMKSYDKFGGINADNMRAIAVVGNALGMFADGVKQPIPKTLFMNDTNVSVTLAMLGLGLKPEMAIAFNFIPEIINAAKKVEESRTGISNEVFQNQLFYGSVLSNMIYESLQADKNNPMDTQILPELFSAGLLDNKRNPITVPLNMENLSIEFTPNKLDAEKIKKGEVTTEDIGFKVSSKKTGLPLSERAQRIVLLKLYQMQASQSFDIMAAGSIINLFKSLKPSFATFDKMMKNVKELFGGKLFTEESLERMKKDQVWDDLMEMMEDLNYQSGLLFFDRSEFFKPIKSTFEKIFKDKSLIANTVVGYVALKKLRDTLPGSRTSSYERIQSLIDEEDQFIKDVFTAEFWFTNTLGDDLLKFQAKYPNNKFLGMLKEQENDRYVVKADVEGGKVVRKKMRYITSIPNSVIKGDLATTVVNDAYKLTEDLDAKLFLKKLLYQDYARTALGSATGSYSHLIPSELKLQVSQYIDEFSDILSSAGEDPGNFDADEFGIRMKNFLGLPDGAKMDPVYDLFSDMLIHLGYAAVKEPNNTSIKFVGTISTNADLTGNYGSGFAKSLKNIGDAPTQVSVNQIFTDIIREMFDRPTLAIPKSGNRFDMTKLALGEEFTIDLELTHANAQQLTMDTIAKQFSITVPKGKDNSRIGEGVYQFPLIMKFKDKAYILQGVDGSIEKGTIGKNVYDSITTNGVLGFTGKKAKYVLLPNQMMGDSLSPAAFDVSQSKLFAQLTSRKSALKLDLTGPEEVPTTLKEKIEAMGDVASQVLEGDIFTLEGIPVIPTNLGGVHGAGLASTAKNKGLIKQGNGSFEATDSVVRFPVKKIYSDNMNMNNNMELLKTSLNRLQEVAENNPKNTYLLPLAGTGHGEGDLSVILPLLVETVMETPNIKLVVPKEDTNLGKMGTVRKDSTMKNLPMIREVLGLSEAPKAEPIVKEEAPVTSTDNSNASDVFLSDEEEDGFEPDNDMLNLILQNQNNSSITSGNPSPANASLPGGPEETTLEKDLRELNLTNEVLEYLYNDRIGGGQPISFEAYSREVEDIVDASKANNIPNDVILNQIKCI